MPRLRILATSILFQAPNNSVNRLGIKCVSSERYFTTKTRSIFTHNAGSAATTSIIASRLLPSSLFPKVNLSSRVFSVVPSSANFSSCTSSSALCTTLQSWTNGGATNIRLHPRPLLPRLVNVTPFCRSLHTEGKFLLVDVLSPSKYAYDRVRTFYRLLFSLKFSHFFAQLYFNGDLCFI